ncbi:hypothetical protein ACS0TY_023741 [Phlomoides rotata]
MGRGWRRAFCNTNTNRRGEEEEKQNITNPFFTPRLRCKTISNQNGGADIVSPKFERKSPGISVFSNPFSSSSSPRSPFSILKSTLRISRNNNCGVCSQIVKTGQKTAIYTAECSHTFHFPCIASHVRNQGSLICPLCSTTWKHAPPFLPLYTQIASPTSYADDDQLIDELEQDMEVEVEEFRGFFVNPISSSDVELSLQPDAAVISQGRTHLTYAVVLKVRAPPPPATRRPPIDLVTVLDVSSSMSGAKLEMLKRAMRLVIGSLGSADRLSILAFSAAPNRLLPLRRMTPQVQRSARRIIDLLSCSPGSCIAEALKEATRVLEQRRQRNPVASIILLSDCQDDAVSGNNERTRYSHVEIPVHSTGFSRNPADNAVSKCVAGLLSVVVQDLRIQIGFAPGSDPAEITAIYSCNDRPALLGSGCILLGDLYAEEEKELLVEIQVPVSRVGSHYVISGMCSRKDPVTQELIYGKEQALLVPRAQTVRSGFPSIDKLRNVFISSRAVAESRSLI